MLSRQLSHREALLLRALRYLHETAGVRESTVGGSLALALHLPIEHRPAADLDLQVPSDTIIDVKSQARALRDGTQVRTLSQKALPGHPHVLLLEIEVGSQDLRSRVRVDIDRSGVELGTVPHSSLPSTSGVAPISTLLNNKLDLAARRISKWGAAGLTVENLFDLAMLAKLARAERIGPHPDLPNNVHEALQALAISLDAAPPPWRNGWRKLLPESHGLDGSLGDAMESLIQNLSA